MVDVAISDLQKFQIPNRVPLTLIAAFLIMAMTTGMGWSDFLVHLGVGFTLFLIGAILFATRIWGGGDAKLLPAVALWVGLVGQPRFLLVMACAGGLLGVVALIVRRLPLTVPKPLTAWRESFVMSGQVPYGIAIAAAGIDWWVADMLPRFADAGKLWVQS
jgi:prepilin peptidase CpaA